MNDLDRLTALIATHWVFDEKAYPELKGKSPEEVRTFAFRHSALHFAKTAGNVVAINERSDHGTALDTDALKEQTGKMLISVLMLAHLLGLSGDDLTRFIEQRYSDQSPPESV